MILIRPPSFYLKAMPVRLRQRPSGVSQAFLSAPGLLGIISPPGTPPARTPMLLEADTPPAGQRSDRTQPLPLPEEAAARQLQDIYAQHYLSCAVDVQEAAQVSTVLRLGRFLALACSLSLSVCLSVSFPFYLHLSRSFANTHILPHRPFSIYLPR